ncbi:hypothetical protein GCM10009555_029290 [Acrocarpospora macrocephala]|uniref:Uncharacterized protein n=1 Tax=Acrocarpospora macrocephala TaxID=150177 RepID=A0A5M3WXA0_9ACTN|nr:SIR2 family protein [Acrocarpospora macrocephala]GES11163.1 hypothetical protein Amac_047600 [Acrocarpospora macrocephala]
MQDLRRLAAIASRPDTLLFIGSGVSAWSGLPTWRRLIERLSEYLSRSGRQTELVDRELAGNDLLLAASYGFDQLTPNERCAFLKSELDPVSAEPSPLHEAIVRLGSKCYITTNYDKLLEKALLRYRPDENFDVVTSLQRTEVAAIVQARSEGFIFKSHGDIHSCDSIILTREDYRALHGQSRNILQAMRTLLASRPVVFIGFGLRDPDFLLIKDLLYADFGANPTDHYAIMSDVSALEVDYWRRNYGIHLVSYSTSSEFRGPNGHGELLRILDRVGELMRQDTVTSKTEADDASGRILALARHARRLRSEIREADDLIPLSLRQHFRAGPVKGESRRHLRINLRDALTGLADTTESVIVDGSPGSGKSFIAHQAMRVLSQRLEEACLADDLPDLGSLRVPVPVYLRDYRGDLEEMIEAALPRAAAGHRSRRAVALRSRRLLPGRRQRGSLLVSRGQSAALTTERLSGESECLSFGHHHPLQRRTAHDRSANRLLGPHQGRVPHGGVDSRRDRHQDALRRDL